MGDYKGCVIADFTRSHGLRDHAYAEAFANARLIEASPKMFELLERRLEHPYEDTEKWFKEVEILLTKITAP